MLPWKRTPQAIVAGFETAKDCVRPAMLSGPLAPAVNCTNPSPDVICCCEMAPASGQPSHPCVLVNELPFAVALTTFVQVTPCAPAVLCDGGGTDAGDEAGGRADWAAGGGDELDVPAIAAAIAVKS